jgi:ectoine hydroxylase-related dioxygenase (phytanoyl-CoA dioxygenase family)
MKNKFVPSQISSIVDIIAAIEQDGFIMLDRYLNPASINVPIEEIDLLANNNLDRAGIRNLLEITSIREIAKSKEILSLVRPILGARSRVVRGIFFDKQPNANWKVPWHQDLTIAVKERVELGQYHPWSIKAGIHHVQPPTAILEQMLTVRIHLDRTDESNGALKVIPGSHCHGKLTAVEIDRLKQSPAISCNCELGGILLMRPLLLHASSLAIVPTHRRVIHLEYAADRLPAGLEWYWD